MQEYDDFAGLPPALARHIRESAEWRRDVDMWRHDITAEVKTNTAICSGIQSATTTFSVLTRVMKWVGAMALAVSSIWFLIKGLFSHGSPPPGIGPQ